MTVPRLLNRAIEPDHVYPLYGIRYILHRTIGRITNRKFFHELFGDSSYIVHYLLSLGYKLSPVVQSGSNFGTEVKHDNPYLTSIGSNTMVADGLRRTGYDEVALTSLSTADFSGIEQTVKGIVDGIKETGKPV